MKQRWTRFLASRLAVLVTGVVVLPGVALALVRAGFSSPEWIRRGSLLGSPTDGARPPFLNEWGALVQTAFPWFSRSSDDSVQSVAALVWRAFSESALLLAVVLPVAFLMGGLVALAVRQQSAARRFLPLLAMLAWFPPAVVGAGLPGILPAGPQLSFAPLFIGGMAMAAYPAWMILSRLDQWFGELPSRPYYQCHLACGLGDWRNTLAAFWREAAVVLLPMLLPVILFVLGFGIFVEQPLGLRGVSTSTIQALKTLDYPLAAALTVHGFLLLCGLDAAVLLLRNRLDPRPDHA